MLTHLHSRWFICFPKLRFSDQRKTPQWQTGLCPNKKIAAAIYEYQADCDGEWGKISFDFESSTAEIIHLADWDTIKTNRFANKAVAYLLNCENEKLPKETMVAFEP